MRHPRSPIALLLLPLAACATGGGSAPGPAHADQAVVALATGAVAWRELSLSVRCEAMNPAFCLGAAGFALHPDGTHRVGPDADGHAQQGTLTPDEQARLSAAVAALGPPAAGTSPLCHQGAVPGSSTTLKLQYTPTSELVVYQRLLNPPDSACQGALAERALALQALVSELLGRYYPRPFPAQAPQAP